MMVIDDDERWPWRRLDPKTPMGNVIHLGQIAFSNWYFLDSCANLHSSSCESAWREFAHAVVACVLCEPAWPSSLAESFLPKA